MRDRKARVIGRSRSPAFALAICEALLELIEVQTGSYLGEDGIIRIEHDYRRS